MKKIFYTGAIAAAIFFLNDVKAQGFYTDVNIGYGWGLGESNLGMKTYDDFIGDGDTEEAIYGTLGGGLVLCLFIKQANFTILTISFCASTVLR